MMLPRATPHLGGMLLKISLLLGATADVLMPLSYSVAASADQRKSQTLCSQSGTWGIHDIRSLHLTNSASVQEQLLALCMIRLSYCARPMCIVVLQVLYEADPPGSVHATKVCI